MKAINQTIERTDDDTLNIIYPMLEELKNKLPYIDDTRLSIIEVLRIIDGEK